MSILVSMYGLSFMINNKAKQSFFEYPIKSANPIQLAKELPIILSERHIDITSFDRIQLIHHNQLNTLIPTPLFEADKAKALLNLNVKTLDGDQCQSDLIQSLDAYNYYVVYHKITEYFSSVNLMNQHSATKFFEAI
ncbi:MAG TPA: DUF3822 family protein, partial [Flavobacteriales bacterium]|nr:DUF3822 family protein [Flavobacteriales bacterium]